MRCAQAAAQPVMPPVVSAVAFEAPEPAAALVQAFAAVVLAAQRSRACHWLQLRARGLLPSDFAGRLRLRKRLPRQCSLKVLMKPPFLPTWKAPVRPASRPRVPQKVRYLAFRPKHPWQADPQYAKAPLAATPQAVATEAEFLQRSSPATAARMHAS